MKLNAEYEKLSDTVNYIYFKFLNGDHKEETPQRNKVSIIGPHYHKAVEIKMVFDGELTFGVDGEQIEMKAGDICFADTYQVHFYKSIHCKCYDLVVDYSYITRILGENHNFYNKITNEELFKELKAVFDKTYKVWDEMSVKQREGFVLRVFGTIMQYVPVQKREVGEQKKHKAAKEIIEYLLNHYKEEISMKKLSREFGYAEGYFSKIFNQVLGVSLREYINRYRIEMADKIKKENPSKSLVEISEEVGYNSWATFYRAYSKYSKFKIKE